MSRLTALLALSLAAALPVRAVETPATTEPSPVETTEAAPGPASAAEADEPPPAVDVTAAAPTPETPPAAPVDTQVAEDARRARTLYIVRHAVMGAGVGVVALMAVAAVGTAVVLYVLPRMGGDQPTAFERMLPIEWRRSVSTVLVLGVLPGLLVLTACASAATGISAYRDLASFRGE